MHVKNIPLAWVDLLDEIRHIAPESHIAGGALRDLDNGRPVKDIDIFVPSEADVAVCELLLAMGFERGIGVDLSSMAGADPAVAQSILFEKAGHLPVNLVFLKGDFTVADNLARLDLGLCQIAFDGQCLITTNAYREDREQGVMTVTRCDNSEQMDRTVKRHARLREKYPDHGFRIPTEFRHL